MIANSQVLNLGIVLHFNPVNIARQMWHVHIEKYRRGCVVMRRLSILYIPTGMEEFFILRNDNFTRSV